MAKNRGVPIMLVTTDYPPEVGGLQTYSYRIATELPGGLLSHVLVGRDENHKADSAPAPATGVKLITRIGRTRWRAFWWSMWTLPWFRLSGNAGFFLHMQWTTAIPSWILKRLGTGTGYLVLVHGAELIDPGRPIIAFLRKSVLSGADAVVAGSRHTAEIVAQLGIRCRRLEIIPYGNPLEGARKSGRAHRDPKGGSGKSEKAPPLLLCMHRLVARKGTALLLEAIAGLRHLPWTLEIVGRGEEEAALREKALALGLQDRIRFLAPVDEGEKIRKLEAAALFILPSLPPIRNNHVEGLGLTLLEAQSVGLPVLASRTGGIPEAVQEGKTGVLFRAGDAEDLREKLADLLSSPDKLRLLGAAGPAWVEEHFSWKEGLRTLSALLGKLTGSGYAKSAGPR